MGFRSWVKLLATTTAAAAVVGAGQLGLAYGLSMVRLDRDLDVTASDLWTSQLAWVAWIAMTAAAVGAIVGTGFRPRWLPQPVGTGGALGVGLAGGLGALVVLPLTMQPARSASVAGVDPVFVIGVCAVLGAAVGIFAAWAAAARAVARWNLGTMTVLVWIVALIAVTPSLLPGRTPAPVRLGVLDGSLIPAAVVEHTPFVTMPVLALLTGLILGWVARGRRMPITTVALTGLAGPALLTVAYLIAGPGESTGFTFDPYWAAMTASGAGVLGSVLAAIVRGTPSSVGDAPAGTAHNAAAASDSTAPDSTASGSAASGSAASHNRALNTAQALDAEFPPLPRRDPAPQQPQQSRHPQPSHQPHHANLAAAAAQRPDAQLRPSDTGVIGYAGDRPHPFADLANQAPANAPASPFSSGSGTPFGQQQNQHQNQQQNQQQAPAPRHSGPPAPEAPARFSGQQDPGPSPRRGWRTRRPAPENPPSPGNSFDGFTTANPSPRTGIDTAELPRVNATMPRPQVVEPTSISGPPPRRGPQGQQESEYEDWMKGLGNS
ncbi:hypothetical protein ACQP2E_03075 [Actinoplanes sp. CA-015351]|uniref:hypothetical protein n=1 Tax=Actinoplanes sp. CA-015351 TaxID=3239897 RepID=UPI003D99E821